MELQNGCGDCMRVGAYVFNSYKHGRDVYRHGYAYGACGEGVGM